MPLEFLLSVHIATMAPDLTYKLATSFDTEVKIILEEIDNITIEPSFSFENGGSVTHDWLNNYNGNGNFSRAEAYDAFVAAHNDGIALVSQTEGNYICSGPTSSEKIIYSNEDGALSDFRGKAKDYNENGENETLDAPIDDDQYDKDGNGKITVSDFDNDGDGEITTTEYKEYIKALMYWDLSTYLDELSTTDKPMKKRAYEVWSNLTDDEKAAIENHINEVVNTFNIGTDSNNFKIDNGEGYDDNVITLVSGVDNVPISNNDNAETVTAELIFYLGIDNDLSDEYKVELAWYFADPDLPEGTTCSDVASSDKSDNYDTACKNCQKYLKDLWTASKKIEDSGLDTYYPYIKEVDDHWFRNVYFQVDDDEEVAIVNTDEKYENETDERWTLYETYSGEGGKIENSSDYKLYVYKQGDDGEYGYTDDNGNYILNFYEYDDMYVLCKQTDEGNGNYKLSDDGITYIYDTNGNYKLVLDDGVDYEDYTGDNLTKFRVSKKAITEIKTGWSAYGPNVEQTRTVQMTESENSTIASLLENVDGLSIWYTETGYVVNQVEDGVRGETNAKIKQLFLDDYYLYDGSTVTAALIEAAKDKVKTANKSLDSDARLDYDDPDSFKSLVESGTIEDSITIQEPETDSEGNKVYDDEGNLKTNTYTATIDQISGAISLTHTSLSAFSILENMHTIDAEHILHDFKELVVELDYFDKEDLVEPEEEVMMFPISGISSAGWPVSRYDKDEEFYGTLIHSSEDLEALRAETEAEIMRLLNEEEIPDAETSTEAESETITNETVTSRTSTTETRTSSSSESTSLLVQAASDVANILISNNGEYCQGYQDGAHEAGSGNTGHATHHRSISLSELQTYYTTDCSGFVSICLQQVGILSEGTACNSQGFADALSGASIINNPSESQLTPGMICVYTGHVNIYAGDGKYYDWGGKRTNLPMTYGNSPTYAISLSEEGMSYNGITGSDSNSVTTATFAGFSGEEAQTVVAPVSGEVIKYGIVDRKNLETSQEGVVADSTSDKVGYIKIKVLDGGIPGQTCTAYSNLGENSEGFNYFWEEYNDAGITGYVLYMEGFDISAIPDVSQNVGSSSENIQALYNYIISDDTPNNYTTKYEVPNLLDDNREEELRQQEQAKQDALYAYYDDETGKLYVKEGAAIGYTYTNDTNNINFGTKTVTTTETTTDADGNEVESETSEEYQVGNYMRLIFRDIDDEVMENVEDFIEVDEAEGSSSGMINDWALLYFLPYESGALDEDGSGPEIVDTSTDSNFDVGIIQWTSNGGSSPGNVQAFMKSAMEIDPEFCKAFADFVDMDDDEIRLSENRNKIANVFSDICDEDRDKFLEIQVTVAKEGFLQPAIDANPWLETAPSVVQGTIFGACVYCGSGQYKNMGLVEGKDENNIEGAFDVMRSKGGIAKRINGQTEAASDILHNNVSEEEIEAWVRTQVSPVGCNWGEH